MIGEEVFRSGTLEMSARPWDDLAQAAFWTDLPLNRILCLVAVALMVVNLIDYFRLFPSLLYCIDRSHGAETLEHSLGLARTRTLSAIIYILPLCLAFDRYQIIRPHFWSAIPPAWSAPAMFALFAAYMLVRDLCYLFFRPRRLSGESYAALRHNPFNYLLLVAPILFVTMGVAAIFHLPADLTRYLFLGELLLVWAVSLVRSGQILRKRCTGLSTFLYLCALELVPAALLAAVVILF
ncbi:MAG: DUF4271 domain-containing protein [Bacteroidales bacterium]|nr:DUF4271 domain-containing protein [Bacteroidales bacterium]